MSNSTDSGICVTLQELYPPEKVKIPILISRLTDSPYSVRTKSSFHFDDDESVSQLATSISKSNPTSFLISGYRGVGKTSFVNRLHEKLGAKTVFVNLSVARYDGYATLVKRLIRQLYHSYRDVRTQTPNEEESKMQAEFDILYDRTFHDVTHTRKNSESISEKKQRGLTFDFGKILAPLSTTVFMGFNIPYNFLQSKLLAVILFIMSLAWTITAAIKLSFVKITSKNDLNETLRKTLYDDEIAEHHLFGVLEKLKVLEYQTVIVFDELDKIKKLTSVEKIINDIKVLLLSGHANFFVISGQGLYYQLEAASDTDDAVVSSLFSKKIHIPFLTNAALRTYVYSMIADQALLKDKLISNFIDSLILESSRIPRRLSNLIRDRIIWEDGTPYIVVNDSKADAYAREATVFSVMSKISDADMRTNNPVKIDFFTAHLHMWLSKMKGFQSSDFSVRDIVERDPSTMQDSHYPPGYLGPLMGLGQLFFDRLFAAGLLTTAKNDNGPLFAWSAMVQTDTLEVTTVTTTTTTTTREGQQVPGSFLQEYADLERTVRNIFIGSKLETIAGKSRSLKQMILNLMLADVFKKAWKNSKPLDELIAVRNKVAHGISVDPEDLKIIERSRFNIIRLKNEFIEEYFKYVVRNYLQDYAFTGDQPFDSGFDFIASGIYARLLFEVRHLRNDGSMRGNVQELAERIINYERINNSNNFYIIFMPQSRASAHAMTFTAQLFEFLGAQSNNLAKKTFVMFVADNEQELNNGFIEDLLQNVLNEIGKLNEVAPFLPRQMLDNSDNDYFTDAEESIRTKAKQQWPDDILMQTDVIEGELNAIEALKRPRPPDIPENMYYSIRAEARKMWPHEYVMQWYEQEHEIEAFRKMNNKI